MTTSNPYLHILQANSESLATDPPHLTFKTAPQAFPSMHNTTEESKSGEIITPTLPLGADRLANLEVMMEVMLSKVSQNTGPSTQALPPSTSNEASRHLDQLKGILSKMVTLQQKGIEAQKAQAAHSSRIMIEI